MKSISIVGLLTYVLFFYCVPFVKAEDQQFQSKEDLAKAVSAIASPQRLCSCRPVWDGRRGVLSIRTSINNGVVGLNVGEEALTTSFTARQATGEDWVSDVTEQCYGIVEYLADQNLCSVAAEPFVQQGVNPHVGAYIATLTQRYAPMSTAGEQGGWSSHNVCRCVRGPMTSFVLVAQGSILKGFHFQNYDGDAGKAKDACKLTLQSLEQLHVCNSDVWSK